MLQIILHAIGDYLIQNDWMALNKKKYTWLGELACQIHCITYALPFLFIGSWKAVLAIYISHYIIDRTNIVGWYLMFKNGIAFRKVNTPDGLGFPLVKTIRYNLRNNINNFGFDESRPAFISIWLYIIVDNVFHIICNYLSLKYL